ncbi:MAG TPA: PhoU domain-containing protein [Nitrososphaerales archaeon]|nr:PhoU domain-containing protein [Nitrososphaerales archaeon]
MARLIDIGLERVSDILMDMANLSEKSVSAAIESYITGRARIEEIRSWSEEIRQLQDDVSELCVDIIARYQPVASDLRFVKAAMDIAYGFSRFGRYAYDIVDVLELCGDLTTCDKSIVELTSKTTREMLKMSVDAFANRDIELAKNVQKMDDFVDDKFREAIDRSIHATTENVKCAVSESLILRYLERISDHASYIGDSVLYIVTGERAPRK